MSTTQRLALIAVAVVIAVGAFVILSGGDDDDDSSSAPTAQTTEDQGSTDQESTDQGSTETDQQAPKPDVTRIKVQGGKPVGGVQQISVKTDDTVALIVSSQDTTSEVHVHGFDIKKEVKPGKPASFLFRADIEGVFDVELEETETQIASLKVEPG